MGKRVGNEKITREKGYLYYVGKDGRVWRAPMKAYKGKGLRKGAVGKDKIERKKGYMYYVGKDGFVHEARMKNAKK